MQECKDRYAAISVSIVATNAAIEAASVKADIRMTRIETLFTRMILGVASAAILALVNIVLHFRVPL